MNISKNDLVYECLKCGRKYIADGRYNDGRRCPNCKGAINPIGKATDFDRRELDNILPLSKIPDCTSAISKKPENKTIYFFQSSRLIDRKSIDIISELIETGIQKGIVVVPNYITLHKIINSDGTGKNDVKFVRSDKEV
jgi:DNA-directed RNA polymerase subunit RPC12/RpoP